MHHVIVGNSIAGIEAALAIRTADPTARITVISAEHPHPVARVAWMYVLAGQLRLEDTEFHERDVYAKNRLDRVTDRVVGVDAAQRAVRLASGSSLNYDRLLLAVGSVARRLPFHDGGAGIHTFVTLADLEGLKAAAAKGQTAAVIGGGLIGVEVAETLHLLGLHVHFLIREPWAFPVSLDANEAEVVAAHIRGHGVDVRTGSGVSEMKRAGGKMHLTLPDGELAVDLVVGAIGVVPNTGFLTESGIELSRGGAIETKPNLESRSTPGVFAAGDCANVDWIDGSRRPEQLWYTARDQGRAAARSMIGSPEPYRRGTWYNSAKFFDLEYTTAGFVPVSPAAGGAPLSPGRWQTWYQANPKTSTTQRIVLKDDRIVGFNALGSRWDHQVILRFMQDRRPLDWVLQHLEEARFDEEFMPPFRVLPTATLQEGA